MCLPTFTVYFSRHRHSMHRLTSLSVYTLGYSGRVEQQLLFRVSATKYQQNAA